MDLTTGLILATFVLLIVWRMVPTKGVKQITIAELKNKLSDQNIQFVDVRTPGEFKGNHIREFKNIPLHQLQQKSSSLSKDKEVVVICQSGMRSNNASKVLKKLGFKTIANVKGGMSAWY
jgi:rhodanese-related sulfurtransferase